MRIEGIVDGYSGRSAATSRTAAFTINRNTDLAVNSSGKSDEASFTPQADSYPAKCLESSTASSPLSRILPRSLSTVSLMSAMDDWASAEEGAELYQDLTLRPASHCMSAACGSEEHDEDGDIPYDYDSEMEECSQYTFSAAPFSPSTTAALAAALAASSSSFSPVRGLNDEETLCTSSWPRTPCASNGAGPGAFPAPLSPQWYERQERDINVHTSGVHYAWQQRMRIAATSSPDQTRYALRSLVREARCREMRRLRAEPPASFVRMDLPQCDRWSRMALRASCLLASAASATQRKARYLEVVSGHWDALEVRVEDMLKETEQESTAASESRLRSIGYALNAQALFSNDSTQILREMNMSCVEAQRRQRHERESRLLATLVAQNRLFLLPTLYAEECEEPVAVPAFVEERPGMKNEEEEEKELVAIVVPTETSAALTHPWQLLSPGASLYAPDSVGELSPSLSCGPWENEEGSPTGKGMAATPFFFTPEYASHTPPHVFLGGSTAAWRDMQPPQLPLLDLFLTAPAVVPSTVVANSGNSVPYVMPVDPSYANYEARRLGVQYEMPAYAALSSPQMSSAMVRASTWPSSMMLDSAEDVWGNARAMNGDAAELEAYDWSDAHKLADVDPPLFYFDVAEALQSGNTTIATAGAAPARVSLTDG